MPYPLTLIWPNIPPADPESPAVQRLLSEFDSPASRAVQNRGGNCTGVFPSSKNRSSMDFESGTAERTTLHVLDYDPQVKRYKVQPKPVAVERVDRRGRTITRDETPDALVELIDGRIGYIQEKTAREVHDLCQGENPRFVVQSGRVVDPAFEKALEGKGLFYVIVSEADFPPILIRNLKLVLPVLHQHTPNSEVLGRIQEIVQVSERGLTSLKELKNNGLSLPAVHALLATGKLVANIDYQLVTNHSKFLIFRNRAALETWLQSEGGPRSHEVAAFLMRSGIKFSWLGEECECIRQFEGSVMVKSESRTDTFRLEYLRAEWTEGRLRIHLAASKTSPSKLPCASDIMEAEARFAVAKSGEGRSERTRRRYRRIIAQSSAAGENIVDALAPKTSRKGNRTLRISGDRYDFLVSFLKDNYYQPHRPRAAHCYKAYVNECGKNGTRSVSRDTFYRHIRILNGSLNSSRVGKHEAYQEARSLPHANDNPLNLPGDQPFSSAQVDHSWVDLVTIDPKTGEPATRKIWITVMIDTCSRAILAVFFTFRAPSRASTMMVIRDCVRRHNTLPDTIATDNGADFQSHYFRRILTGLGVETLYRPPRCPRHGAIIERFFKTFTEGLVQNIPGNIQALQHRRSLSKETDPRRLAIETFASFTEKAEQWIFEVYNERCHGTLGVTPNQVLKDAMVEQEIAKRRIIAYDAAFIAESAIEVDATTRKLQPNGVCCRRERYDSPLLRDHRYIGKSVEVRWDPMNRGVVYVLLGSRWVVATSRFFRLYGHMGARSVHVMSEVLEDFALATANVIETAELDFGPGSSCQENASVGAVGNDCTLDNSVDYGGIDSLLGTERSSDAA